MPGRRDNKIGSLAESFQSLKNDYNAAKPNRFRRQRTGVQPMGSGADWHLRVDQHFWSMMEQARAMDRDDVLVGQMLDKAVNHTLQDGLKLDPQTGDKELDKDLKARWKDWSEDAEQCDLAGEDNFNQQAELALRSRFLDGDVFALPTIDGALQMIEAHRCRTPKKTTRNVVNGILLDDNRRRQEYWFSKDDISPNQPLKLVSEVNQLAARDEEGNKQVFHHLFRKRISQTRGVTALAPAFDCVGMFEDINFAKLVQQQIVSCFAILEELELNYSSTGSSPLGEQSTEPLSDGSTRSIEGIAPGMRIRSAPGAKIKGFSPGVPNQEFFQHVKLIITLIGNNIGLPLVMVLMDASEANFSAYRAAVEDARKGFKRNQRLLAAQFHTPTYLWKLRQWLAEDTALRSRAAQLQKQFFCHRWNSPTWQYIEPLKDGQADLLRVRNGLISPRRLAHENGYEQDELDTESIEDNSSAIRKALIAADKLNKEFPDAKIHWREVISRPLSEGMTIKLTGTDDGPADDPAANTNTKKKAG